MVYGGYSLSIVRFFFNLMIGFGMGLATPLEKYHSVSSKAPSLLVINWGVF